MKEKSAARNKIQHTDTPGKAPEIESAAPLQLSKNRRTATTVGVVIGMFLSALEATAVSTAMPTVVSSLGGLTNYSWVFSAYILTSTVSVPIWGKLSDLYGRRIFYIIGIAIFLVGSALSGQSTTMIELIVFRALQGFGGGALITLGMIIVGEIFSLEQRAKVQGIFGGVWGFSSIAGPIIGGFITDNFSWRWVFYLNIPFGIIAALVTGFALKERVDKEKKVYLDYGGAIVLTVLITLLLLGLMEVGKENSLNSSAALLMLGACVPLFWLFIITERRAKDPVLPLDLFSNPFFKTSAITGFLVGMAMFGAIYFIPLFIQGVIGTSATRTGTVLMPLLLSWVTFSSVSGRLMLRFGYRPLVILGTLLVTVGFLLLSQMNQDATQARAMANMVILGSGMGMIFIPLILAVQNSVPKSRFGIATSATQFFRLIGGAIGVSIMGVVMSAYMHRGFDSASKGISSSEISKGLEVIVNPALRGNLSAETIGPLRQVLDYSLHYVFITGLIIAVLAFLSAFLTPKEKVGDRNSEESYSSVKEAENKFG